MSDFGEILKSIRRERGWSLEEMAEVLGSSKQVLSRYEIGQRIPKVTTVAEFAKKLNVPIERLAGTAVEEKITDEQFKHINSLYAQLTPENQQLAADFLTMLLNKQ